MIRATRGINWWPFTESCSQEYIQRERESRLTLKTYSDMSVIRDDYTFATTNQEIFHIPTRSFPLYGEADSCSFENDRYPTLMGNCPEPGTMVINTRGTGLKVDPSLTWQLGGYEPRIESFSRSADGHVIQAAIDGWCRYYTPSSTMFLHADSNDGQKGTASIPICPDLCVDRTYS
ncbi:uncharacterized protein [Argopecten irradians]|uniref:uncharacterized protein n=1 Tax=Argopecten irradians TaxID=31199 RepID=UPI00371ED834